MLLLTSRARVFNVLNALLSHIEHIFVVLSVLVCDGALAFTALLVGEGH